MRASILLAVASFAVFVSAAPPLARPAFACSPVPGFHPVTDSDLIVAGRIERWERVGATGTGLAVPIRLFLAVDWVFKGEADAEVVIEDYSLRHDGRWQGNSCSAFLRDPAGAYAVIGLNRAPNGTYGTSIFKAFSIGAEPGSVGYRTALGRIRNPGEVSLNLADPRPCIPQSDADACSAERRALWDGDPAAWAIRGVTDEEARLRATVAFRAEAGDRATIAALAVADGRPYVQVKTLRYAAGPVSIVGFRTREPAEFVQVVNLGGADQDLTGWIVRSPDRDITMPLPHGYVLRPGETCRLTQPVPRLPGCGATFEHDDPWPNGEGRVQLVDPDGVVHVDLRYSGDPYDQPPPPNLQGVRLPR